MALELQKQPETLIKVSSRNQLKYFTETIEINDQKEKFDILGQCFNFLTKNSQSF